MKAAAFDYRRPPAVPEALALLADPSQSVKVLAGSQSLGPMLNLRLVRPALLVDISGIASLAEVRTTERGIVVGAGVTHAAIEDGRHPALAEHPLRGVAAGIAYRAVRNRGTIGGSLAHADPAADWVVTLSALDAVLVLQSPAGWREVAMSAFMQGAYTTALAADELITAVVLPARSAAARWGYVKECRKPGEFAHASAAAWFDPARQVARIVLGAVDGAPLRLEALASAIARGGDAAIRRDDIAAAVAQALPERDAIDRQLYVVCVERALQRAGFSVPMPPPLPRRPAVRPASTTPQSASPAAGSPDLNPPDGSRS